MSFDDFLVEQIEPVLGAVHDGYWDRVWSQWTKAKRNIDRALRQTLANSNVTIRNGRPVNLDMWEVCRAYKENRSVSQLSRQFGVSRPTMYATLLRATMEIRRLIDEQQIKEEDLGKDLAPVIEDLLARFKK